MTLNIFRGDSPAIAQSWRVEFTAVEDGDGFTLAVNGKELTVTATADNDQSVIVAAFVVAINASEIPEWQEILATKSGSYLFLSAVTEGEAFLVTGSTTNSETSASIEIVETVAGVEAVNEVQTVQLSGTYTGGTFTLAVDLGSGVETTAAIAYNASASAVEAALEGLASVTSGDVSVTGDAGGPWFVEWKGTYAVTEVDELVVNGASLTGTNVVNVETIVNGYGGADTVYLISTTGENFGDNSGTFTLTHSAQTTAALAFDATPAAIQTALEGLSSIGVGNVEVSGFVSFNADKTGAVYVIRFVEDFAGTNVTLTANSLNLAISADVEKITIGGASSWDEVQVFDLGGTDNSNPSGDDRWVYSHVDTNDTSSQAFGRVEDGDGNTYDYSDDVVGDSETEPFAPDLARLETLYGVTAGDIIGRHFVSGSGFVAVFTGASADDTDHPEGQIGTGGVISSLDHAAAVATVIDGGSGSDNEEQSVEVTGTGGTFTLTLDTETTAAIAAGALASAVETALEALSNIGAGNVSVSGTGTFADPYLVEFVVSLASTNLDEMTGDGSSLTGGSGQVTESTGHVVAVNETQTITVDPGVTGGTFTLSYGGETTAAIPYNESAANLETAFELLSSVAGVAVTGSAGGPWVVEFDTAPDAGSDVELITADATSLEGGTGTQAITFTESTRSSGPEHYDDPLNWTLGRIPNWGDKVVLESSAVSIRFGLKQFADFVVITASNELTIEDHNFRDNQAIQLTTTTTLPTGLALSTTYYVIEIDKDTIQLETSIGGGAVGISSLGTGTHTAEVALESFEHMGRCKSRIGLPERDSDSGYYQYRPRYLATKINGDDAREVTIGEGAGASSGRLNLDFGDSQLVMFIHQTGSNDEAGVPALLLKNQNASTTVEQLDGEVGIAFYRGEVCQISRYTQRSGLLITGGGHVNGDLEKTGGERAMLRTSVNGTLIENL